MALQQVLLRRIDSFITSLRANAWSAGDADANLETTTNSVGADNPMWYYPRLDRIYALDSGDAGQQNFCYVDPLLTDFTSPASGYVQSGAQRMAIIAIGEWDQVTNTQRIYGALNTGSHLLNEMESGGSAPALTNKTTFPFHAGARGTLDSDTTNSGISSATNGYRDQGEGTMVFFETAGFALQPSCRVRYSGTLYDRVLARIDLTTGLAVPEATFSSGFKISYDTAPHQFENPPIFGSRFVFQHLQFIPDDDSLPATPKGRLFMSTVDAEDNLRYFPTSGLPAANALVHNYVTLIEFNPFGISPSPGSPNRVHGRQELFSRYTIKEEAEPESGGIGVASSGEKKHETVTIFHPPSNQLINLYREGAFDNDNVEIRHAAAPELDILSTPTAINEVETNKTVTFESMASGDIAEPIASLSIAWDLTRVSTYREALDTVGLPATSTVENPAIDAGTLVVEYDNGTTIDTLVEGAGPTGDYTVVESTGVITWQNGPGGNHPLAETGYLATYEHASTPATPPHGVLQTQLSRTNEVGIAQARIKYPDDDTLVGQKDRLNSDVAT